MSLTLEETITEVETLLHQVAGPSVQKYSGPIIAKKIQDAFNALFTNDWWPQFRWWQTQTLDGSTGFATNASEFSSWTDIKNIFPSTETRRLSQLPDPMNPFLLTGTTPMFVEPQAGTKLFRIWPLASVGTIYVQGRKKPANFALTETIDFDEMCLQHLAAWMYATADGNNPAYAELLQTVYESRLKQLKGEMIGNIPIDYDPRFAAVPTIWTEIP